MAAIGSENQVLFEVAVRLTQKRRYPGIVAKSAYQRIPVFKHECCRFSKQSMYIH
jgi:hypothetical protein